METALDVDEEMHLCIVFSSFASVSARVFAMRKLELQMVNSDKLEFTAHEIQNCEERLHKILEQGVISSSNSPRVDQCVSVLLIFEAELACRMREWQLIPKVVQKVGQCQASPCDTFEAITDMLVSVSKRQNNLPNYAISSGPPQTAPWMFFLWHWRYCRSFVFPTLH